MGAKDNAAVIQLFDLLESRYAMRVIWALSDGHPQTFRLLQDSVGGVTPNTLNTRLKELRAARLVDHTGDGYRLTHAGRRPRPPHERRAAVRRQWAQQQAALRWRPRPRRGRRTRRLIPARLRAARHHGLALLAQAAPAQRDHVARPSGTPAACGPCPRPAACRWGSRRPAAAP